MATDTCPDCIGERSCNNWHIYRIQLKPNTLQKEAKFPFEGELAPDKQVYYVGITQHTPNCRYNQHVAKRSRVRKRFNCPCFTDEPELRDLKKPGRFIKGNNEPMGLDANFCQEHNPIVRIEGEPSRGYLAPFKKEAEHLEKQFTADLRADGHAVHSN